MSAGNAPRGSGQLDELAELRTEATRCQLDTLPRKWLGRGPDLLDIRALIWVSRPFSGSAKCGLTLRRRPLNPIASKADRPLLKAGEATIRGRSPTLTRSAHKMRGWSCVSSHISWLATESLVKCLRESERPRRALDSIPDGLGNQHGHVLAPCSGARPAQQRKPNHNLEWRGGKLIEGKLSWPIANQCDESSRNTKSSTKQLLNSRTTTATTTHNPKSFGWISVIILSGNRFIWRQDDWHKFTTRLLYIRRPARPEALTRASRLVERA